ncbi:MAG: hypothetical protein NC548_45140 [Lachnospiraceae bacterium]|nr:hypothetical protein [Lachnospiraceae bacterium]
MDNLNYIFFEEYKHLDKLCGELYASQYGITQYIDDMKSVSENQFRYIPNWTVDLKQLKRLRHIRNQLAHTEGAFLEEACTQSDIDWLKDFHGRILHQSDPLAVLHQSSKTKQHTAEIWTPSSPFQLPQQSIQYSDEEISDTEHETDHGIGIFSCILLVFVIIGAIVLVLAGAWEMLMM